MSSMLNPIEPSCKSAASPASDEQQQRMESNANNLQDSIPTYTESSTAPLPSLLPPASELPGTPSASQAQGQTPASVDLPPTYTTLDTAQTTFMIYGTYVHTPAGPAYQLSSALDQRTPIFRIRRLSPREVPLVGVKPISFSKEDTLYEINDPPLLDNEVHVRGKRASCLPGVLELKFGLSKWHVRQIGRHGVAGGKGKDILTSKRVGMFGRTSLNRKREEEASEWKDSNGRVVATEVLKKLDDGGVVPVIELSKDLDQTWRELLLSLWAARLWMAFGKEKTLALGGRLHNGGWARLSGAAILGGGWGVVGGVVVAN